jgi:DNA-binding MarR family transcriptional regulator
MPAAPASRSTTWALLLKVHAVLLRGMEERLKQAGLPSLEWYDVLWALEQAPGQRLRMHALAEQLLLTRFNVTRLVDRLEDEGLVSRQKSKQDKRGADAVLTAKGRALRLRMWSVYRAAIDELFNSRLSEAEDLGLRLVLAALLEQAPPPA